MKTTKASYKTKKKGNTIRENKMFSVQQNLKLISNQQMGYEKNLSVCLLEYYL